MPTWLLVRAEYQQTENHVAFISISSMKFGGERLPGDRRDTEYGSRWLNFPVPYTRPHAIGGRNRVTGSMQVRDHSRRHHREWRAFVI